MENTYSKEVIDTVKSLKQELLKSKKLETEKNEKKILVNDQKKLVKGKENER